MIDIATIRAFQMEMARRAAAQKLEPFVFFDEEEVDRFFAPSAGLRFPALGDYCPKGWKLVDSWFCDSSGWGAPDEPALTIDQLQEKIKCLIRRNPGKIYGFGVTEAGQFQVYLGVFEKVKRSGGHKKA